jgi:hypothetical protein
MKKVAMVMILALLTGLMSAVSAQKFTVGVKGGMSIPNLTGGGNENPLNEGYSSRMDGGAGIYGEYHISNLFSLSLGAEYSGQGGKKDKLQAFPAVQMTANVPAAYQTFVAQSLSGTQYLYANFKSEAKFRYLIVPLLAHFTVGLGQSSPWSVYAAVGPFAGFLLNAHQITSGSSKVYTDAAGTNEFTLLGQSLGAISFDANTDIKDQLHTFNVGVEALVGVSYKICEKHSVFIEGGGNYGFIPIQKGSANGKNNTGAGTVSLGYAYTF